MSDERSGASSFITHRSSFTFDPRWHFRQIAVELGQQLVLVFAGKRSGEEAVDPLLEQPPPARFFGPRVDGKEQCLFAIAA